MPHRCCAPGCHSNYNEHLKARVFSFPKDSNLKELWLKAICKENFEPTKYSKLCEKHFKPEDILTEASAVDPRTNLTITAPLKVFRLKQGAIPSIFLKKTLPPSQVKNSIVKEFSVKKDSSMQYSEDPDPVQPGGYNMNNDDDEDVEIEEVTFEPKIKSEASSIPKVSLPSPYKHFPVATVCLKKEDRVIISKELQKGVKRSPSVGSNSSNGSNDVLKLTAPAVKRRKIDKPPPSVRGRQNDVFCWVCHREGLVLDCIACPRAFHPKCAGELETTTTDWVCSECRHVLAAENVDTRSSTLSDISLEKLCALLKCSLNKLKYRAPAAFHQPVPLDCYSSYLEYVIHPMDFSLIEKNIKEKLYGCTEAFLADVKWILHNSCVFNGTQHPLSTNAKSLVKTCEYDMQEIEVCPDCFMHACTRSKYWFSETCSKPHPLVWAKLKGFPYWPAKVVRVLDGNVDARFFGAHDRAWVSIAQCYHLSKEMPTSSKPKKKGTYDTALDELNVHVHLLIQKFGSFEYAPYRTSFDPQNKEFLYHGIDIDKISKEDIPYEPIAQQSDDLSQQSPIGFLRLQRTTSLESERSEHSSMKLDLQLAESPEKSTQVEDDDDSKCDKSPSDDIKEHLNNSAIEEKVFVAEQNEPLSGNEHTASPEHKDDSAKKNSEILSPKEKTSTEETGTNFNSDAEQLKKLELALERIKGYISNTSDADKKNEEKPAKPVSPQSQTALNKDKIAKSVPTSPRSQTVLNKDKVAKTIDINLPDVPLPVESEAKETAVLNISNRKDSFFLKLNETIESCKAKLGISEIAEDSSGSESVEDEDGENESGSSSSEDEEEAEESATSSSENEESASEATETDVEEAEEVTNRDTAEESEKELESAAVQLNSDSDIVSGVEPSNEKGHVFNSDTSDKDHVAEVDSSVTETEVTSAINLNHCNEVHSSSDKQQVTSGSNNEKESTFKADLNNKKDNTSDVDLDENNASDVDLDENNASDVDLESSSDSESDADTDSDKESSEDDSEKDISSKNQSISSDIKIGDNSACPEKNRDEQVKSDINENRNSSKFEESLEIDDTSALQSSSTTTVQSPDKIIFPSNGPAKSLESKKDETDVSETMEWQHTSNSEKDKMDHNEASSLQNSPEKSSLLEECLNPKTESVKENLDENDDSCDIYICDRPKKPDPPLICLDDLSENETDTEDKNASSEVNQKVSEIETVKTPGSLSESTSNKTVTPDTSTTTPVDNKSILTFQHMENLKKSLNERLSNNVNNVSSPLVRTDSEFGELPPPINAGHKRRARAQFSKFCTEDPLEFSDDEVQTISCVTNNPLALSGAKRTFSSLSTSSENSINVERMSPRTPRHVSPRSEVDEKISIDTSFHKQLENNATGKRPGMHILEASNIILDDSTDFNAEDSEEEIMNLRKKVDVLTTAFQKQHWRHLQEKAELRHNMNLIIMEMRASLEADKKHAIEILSKKFEREKAKCIGETKKKQWCASCRMESRYACCWNTSYCTPGCQKRHFPQHMKFCGQIAQITKQKLGQSNEVAKIITSTPVSNGEAPEKPVEKKKIFVVNMMPTDKSKTPTSNPPVTNTTSSSREKISTVLSSAQPIRPKPAPQIKIINTTKSQLQLTSSTTNTQNTTSSSTNTQNTTSSSANTQNTKENESMQRFEKVEAMGSMADSADIIHCVRKRICDLGTAISLLKAKNNQSAASIKKEEQKPEEANLEDVYFPMPKVHIENSDSNCNDEDAAKSEAEAEGNVSDVEMDEQIDDKTEESATEEEKIILSDDEDGESNDVVSIGHGIDVNEKLLNKCLIFGQTPKKLTRCLVDVLFPDIKLLANCSAFGQKSNVTKLTRAALPTKKVHAIIDYVQKRYPETLKTEITLAINMKCKEARKVIGRCKDPNSPSKKPLIKRLVQKDKEHAIARSKKIKSQKTPKTDKKSSPNSSLKDKEESETNVNKSCKTLQNEVRIATTDTTPSVATTLLMSPKTVLLTTGAGTTTAVTLKSPPKSIFVTSSMASSSANAVNFPDLKTQRITIPKILQLGKSQIIQTKPMSSEEQLLNKSGPATLIVSRTGLKKADNSQVIKTVCENLRQICSSDGTKMMTLQMVGNSSSDQKNSSPPKQTTLQSSQRPIFIVGSKASPAKQTPVLAQKPLPSAQQSQTPTQQSQSPDQVPTPDITVKKENEK